MRTQAHRSRVREEICRLGPEGQDVSSLFLSVLLHAGADFFTLFLWELIGTPYALAVRDRTVIYHLAYSPDGTLASIEKIKP
jgi:hypothetical protein